MTYSFESVKMVDITVIRVQIPTLLVHTFVALIIE